MTRQLIKLHAAHSRNGLVNDFTGQFFARFHIKLHHMNRSPTNEIALIGKDLGYYISSVQVANVSTLNCTF